MPLSAQSEGIKPQICPIQSDKSYGYRHVVHTNEFFETVKSWLPRELDPGKIANIASYHHSPSSPLHVIVQQADWLSAGQDRQEDESVSGKRDFCTSIFQSLIKDRANSQEYILPLVPLVLNEKIFPCSSKQTTSPISDYQSLWRAALEHYKQLEPSAPSVLSLGPFMENSSLNATRESKISGIFWITPLDLVKMDKLSVYRSGQIPHSSWANSFWPPSMKA